MASLTCTLIAVFYTVLWQHGWNQTVKVCKYDCEYSEWVYYNQPCRVTVEAP